MAGLVEQGGYPSDANQFLHKFASIQTSEHVDIANLPEKAWGYLMVIKQAYLQYLQVFFSATQNKHYIRSSREGGWSNWIQL